MKLTKDDQRIVYAAILAALEGDTSAWDDLSGDALDRAQRLMELLESSKDDDEDEEDEEEDDEDDEEEEDDDDWTGIGGDDD